MTGCVSVSLAILSGLVRRCLPPSPQLYLGHAAGGAEIPSHARAPNGHGTALFACEFWIMLLLVWGGSEHGMIRIWQPDTGVAKMPSIDPTIRDQLTRALGEAVIRIWSNLPQDLLTRVEIGHIRIRSAGKGRIRSRGSGSTPSQRA
jgi:hypothetical protein